jgi:hypothetical protein
MRPEAIAERLGLSAGEVKAASKRVRAVRDRLERGD